MVSVICDISPKTKQTVLNLTFSVYVAHWYDLNLTARG